MKKIFTSFMMLWLVTQAGMMSHIRAQSPSPLPYTQNFNTANDLTLVNGSETNKWQYGSAIGNTGSSLYISDNSGANNQYNINSASIVHAYKELTIPTGSTLANFSFDWKSIGEVGFDYMRVWLVPATFTPTAGTAITTGGGRIQVGGEFSNQSTWQTYVINNLTVTSFANNTMRLVFEWRNGSSLGTQPPAAIDNINLSLVTCFPPTALTTTATTPNTGTISWTAPATAPANGFEYYYSTTNTPPTATTAASGTSTGNNTTINGLLPNTTYYFWVRSVCSATDKSSWSAVASFTTTQVPATIPYTQNFNTANDFGFVNGNQTNKWAYGTATGNTGSSIYISNNNGTANAYSTGSTSVVHAYRDISVPLGASVATFSFDWKALGEGFTTTNYDYFKVWLVPATFNPTAGTQITAAAGRIQVGGNMNNQTTWINYLNSTLNISSFSNSTMRLVFEWINDGSLGSQPPAAIDNINLFIPSCVMPTALAVNNIAPNGATISWTAPTPAPANGYQYFVTTTNTAPTAATPPTGTTTATSAVLGTLNPNTTYYFWVRSACGTSGTSIWTAGPSFTTPQIPATIPYSQAFTGGNDFGFVNGTQTNQWAFGAATGNTGNSIYISNNNGTANAYTIGSTSVVQAFRDITVPTGATVATLSFDWKGIGEGFTTTNYDYLRVWMVPITFVPTSGTQITAGTGRIQVGGNMNNQATWINYLNSNLNISSFAGSTMRLVFEWRNDGSGGTQPPVAIDNINLTIPSCINPTAIAVNTITANGATISWSAPIPAPANGYQYYISTTNTAPTSATPPTGNATGTSVTVGSLNPNTTYYVWVRSVCSATDSSLWSAGPSFTTTQIPATIPYIQNFTGPNDFGFSNGTQTNKWVYGSATGNTGNSLYISNNGTANAYTISSTSVVQAYRDIIVPAGTTEAQFGFDWKAAGESTYDYLRVWLVPASYQPVAGTQITAGAGRIQVGANYNLQTNWQNFLNATLNISSFAGTTMRVVFEWRNDGSGGTQPPVAIDNVRLLVCNNATPTVTVGTLTQNSAVLNWNQDINGANYEIRYRPVGATTWQTQSVGAAPYPATTNTFTLTNLLPATQYEVEIAAVCKNVAGVYSHNTFITRCDPTPPNVTVTNITSNSALVTWNPLAVSATYELQWREVGTTVWNTPTIPQPPANSYVLSGLASYKTYEVMVRNTCVGETTPNPWSSPQVFTTDRICEIPPPGLTITQLNPTSAEVTWEPYTGTGATNSYILRYRKVGIPSWTNITVNNTTTYTITGLLELTKYEMQVANICTGTPGNFTPLYYFTTPTVVYCQMSSTNSGAEFINKVTVTPFNSAAKENASGASTYTDFTGVPSTYITLVQGSQGNVVKIDKTSAAGSNTGVAVWIDFNRNGYFDVNEKILSNGPNNQTSVSGAFTVPEDAFVSMTDYKYVVMRVAMQKDGVPVNCTSFADGEVEDYTVRIQKKPVINALDQTEIILYPNPVKTVLNIKNISAKANYKIYSAAGQLVSSGLIVNNKIDVSRLINGLYIIDVVDGNITVQKKFIKE
ncbi:fibronectin type III domain-containing protein [Chryseobacterium foetidum]|uniref:fibronectin type III domain-containing protein n=1 Tax=Chryseobacterium foetidum TaxID=2951057 RepID=UPI0021C7D0E0|nr:fibronectin type III domain-containing protein [Chryseobacterium foetidum]